MGLPSAIRKKERKYMAMAWIWTGMVSAAVLFGLVNGTIGAVGSAAMEGAAAAVELCLSMAGVKIGRAHV